MWRYLGVSMTQAELDEMRQAMNEEFTEVCLEDGWIPAMDMLRLEVADAMHEFTHQPSQMIVAFIAIAVEIMAESVNEGENTVQ